MVKVRPTRKQKRLMDELDKIYARLVLDYWDIEDMEPAARTPVLESTRREIIRGEVIGQYTLIDEHLGSKICHYLFPTQRQFQKLWKTQRFALVKDVYAVPKSIASTIEA